MFVIDASVFVADLQPLEPHHAEARAALTHLARNGVRICCPVLVLAEVAAGIARATGRVDLAERSIQDVRQRDRIRLFVVDDELAERAAVISAKQQVRGCDAIYIALAEERRAPLISLDKQQRERVPSGVKAYTPSEVLSRDFRFRR